MTRVVLFRGHHPTLWGLRPFERLPARYTVELVTTGSLRYDVDALPFPRREARAVRDKLPKGLLGDLAVMGVRDRLLKAEEAFQGADIVHVEELSLWFGVQPAELKRRLGFKLVSTVWETLPLGDAYRPPHGRAARERILDAVDLYLPATERARDALLLEGVPAERIEVAYPGVDVERFAAGRRAADPDEHVILSPGRLEWEKGHHDVLRAVAALRRGLVAGAPERLRVRLVGAGPEEKRLREHAAELGIADIVELSRLPYDAMPDLYASASCLVLASLPRSGCALYPGDAPHCFWEEQFGLVLAEAMAAGLPLVLSTSGAIPEVTRGADAAYFAPGDYMELARALAAGPLSRAPGERAQHPPELVGRYSLDAAAGRIAAAYDRLT